MKVEIPGYGKLDIRHMVFDFNGTLADGGRLIPGAADLMNELSSLMELHVITADTFGTVAEEMNGVNCTVVKIDSADQARQKMDFILSLGKEYTAAAGNGNNDRLMLMEARLGISVIQNEGAFSSTVTASDIICTSVIDVMRLFTEPARLIATLRE